MNAAMIAADLREEGQSQYLFSSIDPKPLFDQKLWCLFLLEVSIFRILFLRWSLAFWIAKEDPKGFVILVNSWVNCIYETP